MAKELKIIDLESQHNDKFPLLKDPTSSNKYEEIANTQSTTIASSSSSSKIPNVFLTSNSNDIPSTQSEVYISGPCCNILTTKEIPTTNNLSALPVEIEPSSHASTSGSRPWTFNSNQPNMRQRTHLLNSGIWISFEFIITLGQIVATIVVLSTSNLDDLESLLSIWIVGYSTACLATLPLLYWRYKHGHLLLRNQEGLAPLQTTPSTSTPTISSIVIGSSSYVSINPITQVGTIHSQGVDNFNSQENRFRKFIEKFKVGLDCFFAIWFIIGNVWVFDLGASYEEPRLYRLCVVFLSLSCIAYAMPLVLCTTICCCLPCIVAVLGFHEEQRQQSRGASSELIATLPTYNFKAQSTPTSGNVTRIREENESENNQGGFVGEGTENRRRVSADDALCCICLGKYKDKVDLKELPCSHHFHVGCVDKWLKINASCPLCKHDLISGASGSRGSNTSSGSDEIVNLSC